MNRKFKSILQNFSLFIVGCFIALLLMEAILRIFPLEQRLKGNHIILPINKDYSGKNTTISKVDSYITHKKNSLGFRGNPPPANFSDYLTIITIGGSTTECNYISDGKTWSDAFVTLLRKNYNHVWLNNAGLDGHSTFGHIILMNDIIVHLKPNIVIFLVGANDRGIRDITKYDLENIRTGISFRSLTEFLKSTTHYSEVASVALNLHRYLRAVRAKFNDYEANYEKELREMGAMNAEAILEEKKDFEQKYLRAYELRIRRLIAISRENGIMPIFITQPSLYGNFRDDITGLNFEKSVYKWEILELYNTVLRKCCEAENVFLVDIAKDLPKSSRYFYDWVHYTNEGSQKFGEILFSKVTPYLATQFRQFRRNN